MPSRRRSSSSRSITPFTPRPYPSKFFCSSRSEVRRLRRSASSSRSLINSASVSRCSARPRASPSSVAASRLRGGEYRGPLPLGAQPSLLARDQPQPPPEPAEPLLVLHLPRRDRFALAGRELHLLLVQPQLLVDPVRVLGQVLDLFFVLEQL